MSETWKHNTKKRFFDSIKTRAIILLITFGFFGLILALNYLTTGDINGDNWNANTTALPVSVTVPYIKSDNQPYICLLYTSPSPRDRG